MPGWWPQAQARRGTARNGGHDDDTLPSRLPVGARLANGRYELLGHLGAGGMGHVLRVFDRDLRRLVAMKVLRPDRMADGADFLARFVEEAQVSSQLEHPNIMPVYDLGLLDGGFAYYTMQLVTGRSLAEVLAQPRRTREGLASPAGLLAEGLDIFGKILSGMAYAHDKGVIHRDLKPENIMIGRFDEVLVMDWGLAKIVTRTDGLTAAASTGHAAGAGAFAPVESVRSLAGCHTRVGAVTGTLLYMAPEQANGLNNRLDARTDVWGLGAILYTLLAGRPPHLWGAARHSNEALLRHARHEPVRPIGRRVGEQRVPVELERIALQALERDPRERFANADEMLSALKEFARTVGRRRCVVRGWAGREAHAQPRWPRVAAAAALGLLGTALALLL